MKKPKDIDEYINDFPTKIQELLTQVRKTVKKTAPQAEEIISYGMPAFRQNGNLVWFAAFAEHIGFYPAPTGIEAFNKELSAYKSGKGSVHFPFDKPLPLDLITEIVKFRLSLNNQKTISRRPRKESKRTLREH